MLRQNVTSQFQLACCVRAALPYASMHAVSFMLIDVLAPFAHSQRSTENTIIHIPDAELHICRVYKI